MSVRKEAARKQDAEFAARTFAADKPKAKAKLVDHHVLIHDDDWETLRLHFEEEGVSISSGIRQVLRRYLRDQGLR